MTIGKVAKQAAVGIETVRFYERRGLLQPPPRSDSGYRMYPAETVNRIRFIKNAKKLGFSLNEIADLLTLHHSPTATKAEVKERSQKKIKEIDSKIQELSRMKGALSKLVSACSGEGSIADCPILNAMGSDECHKCHS